MKWIQLIVALSLLVMIHEFGPFLLAKLFKVRVEKFYMFFNPQISLFRAKKVGGKRHFKFFSKNVEPAAMEVIEAKWLFGVPADKIQVLVHPQSIVHSAVQFSDGAVKAQLGAPDMRLPIQYALTYPERLHSDFPRMDLFAVRDLTFEEPDLQRFPNLGLAYEAMKRGGNVPCVLNAANEVANLAFREGRCGFLQMSEVIAETMNKAPFIAQPTYEDYVATDQEARNMAEQMIHNLTI